MAEDKRIWIVHPNLPHAEPTTVLKATFEKTWEGKGWKEIPEDQVADLRKAAREFRNKASITKSQKETTKSGGSSK